MTIPDLSDPRISALEITPMWSGSLPQSEVNEALKVAGVPDELLPHAPTRAVCMRRAFDHCAPAGAKIDGLPKGLGVSMSLKDVSQLDLAELAAVCGNVVRDAPSYRATLSCKILVENINGSETEKLVFSPDDHLAIPLIRDTYRMMRDQYKASEDLSIWFSQTILPAAGAVGKRSRGGVYYVAAQHKAIIVKVAEGLNLISSCEHIEREVAGVKCPVERLKHGGKICIEPRYANDSYAMEIMIDGVIRDADATLDALSAVIDPDPASGKRQLGKRALANKRDECARLEEQLKAWETVCGVSLPLIKNRVAELRAGIGIAELAAEVSEGKD